MNGKNSRKEQTHVPITSSEAKKPDHQVKKYRTNAPLDLITQKGRTYKQTNTKLTGTTSQPAPPQRKKRASPQYTTHSDRVGKYRLRAGYKVKTKQK